MADTILITGASRGIGLATAKHLADAGYAVVGTARHPPEEGFPGAFYAADLSDRRATDQILANISAEHRIDGVVNNVGFNVLEPLGAVELDNFWRVIDLNVRTTIQVTQAVLPGMRERRYGRIVNISSRAVLGRRQRTSYGAAKAGIIGMTRTWALELADEGITANVVSPGATDTEMFRKNNLEGQDGEANRQRFLADIPMRRFGTPAEIAYAIAFFLDRRASFITGQVLHVCGGSSVGTAAL